MTSRPLVDPETLPLLDIIDLGTLSDATLPETREKIAALTPPPVEQDDGVTMRVIGLPGEPGNPTVRALLYEPGAAHAARGAILHIHGGGTVFGKPEAQDAANRAWAASLGVVLLSVDYRLAPEHPFPAALDDCTAALRWLHNQTGALHIDPARIAVMGESAGGGIAASLALRARDVGDLPIALQMLAYPMLDDRTGSAESDPLAG